MISSTWRKRVLSLDHFQCLYLRPYIKLDGAVQQPAGRIPGRYFRPGQPGKSTAEKSNFNWPASKRDQQQQVFHQAAHVVRLDDDISLNNHPVFLSFLGAAPARFSTGADQSEGSTQFVAGISDERFAGCPRLVDEKPANARPSTNCPNPRITMDSAPMTNRLVRNWFKMLT